MLTLALVLAGLAALLHVYIFVLESFRWEHHATLRAFGMTAEQASSTRQLAYNQGFYNLFLAVVSGVGIGLVGSHREAGIALVAAGTASMLAAALVLVTDDASKARGAIVQGTVPALTLLALLTHAVT